MNRELHLNCFFFAVVANNMQVNCNNAANRELVPLHPHYFLPRCVADFARANKVFVGLNCACFICSIKLLAFYTLAQHCTLLRKFKIVLAISFVIPLFDWPKVMVFELLCFNFFFS